MGSTYIVTSNTSKRAYFHVVRVHAGSLQVYDVILIDLV